MRALNWLRVDKIVQTCVWRNNIRVGPYSEDQNACHALCKVVSLDGPFLEAWVVSMVDDGNVNNLLS